MAGEPLRVWKERDDKLLRLRLSRPKANIVDAEMIAAAQTANAHEFIRALPQGYDTVIGEKGLRLSGGQKQRVAIARSLISKPKIIFADEPTGALDSQTSFEVIDILQDINKEGITLIIVTHEHDIAAMTQKIIRLHDGKIAEILENGELKSWKHQYKRELEIA